MTLFCLNYTSTCRQIAVHLIYSQPVYFVLDWNFRCESFNTTNGAKDQLLALSYVKNQHQKKKQKVQSSQLKASQLDKNSISRQLIYCYFHLEQEDLHRKKETARQKQVGFFCCMIVAAEEQLIYKLIQIIGEHAYIFLRTLPLNLYQKEKQD